MGGHIGLDGRDGQDGDQPPPFFLALENWYLSGATVLGRRTAEMHTALAMASGDAFAPELLGSRELDAVARDMRAGAERSLDRLASALTALDPSVRPLAETVLNGRETLLKRVDDIRTLADAGLRIRVHGDYHLGQVLRTEEDFVIVDFEGDTSRPIAERRVKQSPVKDLSGMLRSFSYAAYAALFAFTVHAPNDFDPLEPWAETWCHWVARAFLRGYRGALGPSPLLPAEDATETLLRAFTMEKALQELSYELTNRPEWIRIPLMGVKKLIDAGRAG